MGREVRRPPLDFAWPIGQTWWGFLLPDVPCQLCHGTGKRPTSRTVGIWGYETDYCDLCEGEGTVSARIPIPEPRKGTLGYDETLAQMGWQMWETTSEGSSISPVFRTPGELARWLADTNASACGRQGASCEEWLRMILSPGWTPSMVMDAGGLRSGVAATGKTEETKPC